MHFLSMLLGILVFMKYSIFICYAVSFSLLLFGVKEHKAQNFAISRLGFWNKRLMDMKMKMNVIDVHEKRGELAALMIVFVPRLCPLGFPRQIGLAAMRTR